MTLGVGHSVTRQVGIIATYLSESSSMATPLADLVYQLCKRNQYCSSKFQDLQQKEEWTLNDKKKVLALLTELFVQPTCTEDVTHCSSTILLDLVERVKNVVHETTVEQRVAVHQMFCIALSKAVTVCPSLKRFFLCYLKSSPPFLHTDHDVEEPKSKKLRLDDSHQTLSETHHLELVQTAYRCVVILGRESEPVVCLEHLLPFLTFSNKDVQWFAVQTLATLLQMSARQKDIFTKRYFQKEEIVQLSLRYRKLLLWPELPGNGFTANEEQLQVPTYIADNGLLSSKVVSVSGVLLPKLVSNQQVEQKSELIPVASTMKNLQSLAEAVVLGKPVLLQGPVGSGKTCLVESLAQMTGRHKSPQLLKLQLGDQTDSRALVGIYQCTDIPGEFVWQPGVLTRAVSEGYWVLLEDIDRAPMDVISLLLPLLETNTLMIPNRGQLISASPNFQLFATLRVFPGTGSLSTVLNSGMSVLLEKSWTKVNVEPLSKDELYEVISQKHPSLQSIVERLLEIYFLLSRGEHAGTMTADESKLLNMKLLASDKRLISTRDLLNWCKRILSHDLTSSAISDLVFQETLDCFCFSISCPNRRLQMAEAMGAKLNIAKTKAEYYCMKYKPALQMTESDFVIGRVAVPRKKQKFQLSKSLSATSIPFSFTRQSTSLLEKVTACILHNEPVLLVGETGTGKTSTIQYLAHQLKHTLHIINMNQQSDGTDLLGGFKPVDLKLVVKPFKESFEELFCKTFSRKQNIVFLTHIENCFSKKSWKDLFTLFEHTIKSAVKNQAENSEMWKLWKKQEKRLKQMHLQIQRTENAMAFAFIEGTLVKALRNGDWVLLDEINLATAETLECLTGLLESQSGSVVLSERGDVESITRHPKFRLFACMNPATDVGKKSLTPSLRNRFMEFFVDELTEAQDLKILVNDYLSGLSIAPSQIDGLVNFYLQVQRVASKQLTDGTGHKPHYSLRTFCRALMCSALNPAGNVSRSLYESVCMSFLTQLDRSSYPIVEQLACRYLLEKNDPKSVLSRPMPEPGGKHVQIEGYWIPLGPCEVNMPDKYILTPSVRANLKDLARIVAIGHHPVLLQGETSVGKTSLVQWLASSTGNKCVRINNHEHTDLQEYLGTYAADNMGKLVFKEGILVQAMRQGFWIILDELNLAPTDVLEALNRLLDDNRELFIPETQEMVKAHAKFMLFATQNPPGLYGGRKSLSRAFRNRFVELHFDEIPSIELETILSQRCNLPLSYAKKLVKVMLELQTRRSSSGVFAGKHGFMTLRDLFRWAERYHCPNVDTSNYDWDQHMADHGYMLLAGKMRKPEEEDIVQETLQKYFRRKVSPDCLFNVSPEVSPTTAEMLRKLTGETIDNFEHIFWTPNMQRLAVLVGQAMKYKEPVLLVGETGCGKTTICQLYAAMNETELFTVNCHSNTESADFLGGLRPVRSHEEMANGEQCQQKLFEWVDGPLVKAMENGCPFLIDEISLAEDSVLERLNSVLEPERTLLLAEKGSGHGLNENILQIVAEQKFCIFATMNPGGDFGKKELSPALRNRFTEIWCPQIASPGDMVSIIQHNLQPSIRFSERSSNGEEEDEMDIANAMMTFTEWFVCNDLGKKCVVTIRDLLCWVHFLNTCSLSYEDEDEYMDVSKVDPCIAYVHGACLVFLDCLGTGATAQANRDSEVHSFRDECLQFLLWQVNNSSTQNFTLESLELIDKKQTVYPNQVARRDSYFTVPPFSIPVAESQIYRNEKYAFHAPTTCMNAQRILRALQLSRPILLEGSPGVGKTSLVAAIAAAAGRELVRINLSEQTDIADLFGSDLPVEGGEGGMFCWRDGPFLQALKAGHWIILDELNLASQSVLEGLNACLDHRGEVFIPELGKTFYIQHANTRIFGCQNPYHQGSGRKGLPKSFLNRFTKVYIEAHSRGDLQLIANTMFPSIPEKLLSNMVHFNMKIHNEVASRSWGHKGGPWEFNLRDLFRWCELLVENQPLDSFDPGEYLSLIYIDRMQTQADRDKVVELYQRTFSCIAPIYRPSGLFSLSLDWVQCGHSFLQRHSEHSMHVNGNKDLKMLPRMLPVLESVMKCVQMNWLTILIGEQGSGKTSTVQMLADLTGNNLQILPMNSSMDTTELLGGFEQIDISCHIEEAATSLKLSIDSFTRKLIPLQHFTDVENNIACIHHMWHKYCRDIQKHQSANLTNTEELNYMKKQLKDLKVILVQLLDLNDEDSDELLELDSQLNSLEQSLDQLENTTNGNVFEWINSVLVKALLSGDWLLIDNVNFCTASVLDRLNALLEPSGVLTVSERGVIEGDIPEIVPHPNFRLFFTMDPKYGNISRAMRNRGVEIFILNKSDEKMETIDIDVNNCETSKTTAQLPLASLPLTHQYCSHPLLTQAQHLVSVYIQVLRQLLLSPYNCPNVSASRWPFINFIQLVSSHVHSQNWKFCSELISPLLTEVQLEVNCSEVSTFGGWKSVCGQHDLPELTQVTLVALFDHPLKEILQNYLNSMKTGNNSAEILMRGPYDFRWNRQALHKMISSSKSESNATICLLDELTGIINRIRLSQMLTVEWQLSQEKFKKWELLCEGAQHLGSEKSAHLEVFVYIDNVLVLLRQELRAAFTEQGDCSDKQFYQIYCGMAWLNRLLDVALQHWEKELSPPTEAKLSLIWNWTFYKLLMPLLGHNSPLKLSEKIEKVINHIHKLLGDQNSTSKLFKKMLAGWGHPQPFLSDNEYRQWKKLEDLAQCIELFGRGKNQQISLTQQDILKLDRTSITDQFLKVISQINSSKNLKSAEGNNLLESLFKDLENNISSVSSCSSVTGDNVEEMTESTPDTSAPEAMNIKQQLWPLYEHTVLAVERRVLNLLLKQQEPQLATWLPPLVEFMKEHLPLSPLHLAEYQKLFNCLGQGNSKNLYSSIFLNYYLHWWQNSINDMNTDLRNNQLALFSPDVRGPGIAASGCLSEILNKLISDHVGIESVKRSSTRFLSDSSILLPQVGIGYHKDAAQLFSKIRNHLWVHAEFLSGLQFSGRTIERKNILETFQHTLTAIGLSLPQFCDSDIPDLHVLTSQSGMINPYNFTEKLETFISQMKDCPYFDDVVISLTQKAITSVQEMFMYDDQTSVMAIGSSLVLIGLLQSYLLGPRGHLDPVERDKLKLSHVQEDLEMISLELDMENVFAELMTGRSFTETCHNQLHPHIIWLMEHREKLTNKVHCLLGRTAHRPEVSLFPMLKKDYQNFLQTGGSCDFILNLLHKAKNLETSNAENDDLSQFIQEVITWQRTLHNFLQKMQDNYSLYKDILMPFYSSLHQMSHGFGLISQTLQVSNNRNQLAKLCDIPKEREFSWLEDVYVCMNKFPSCSITFPDFLRLSMDLTSNLILGLSQALMSKKIEKSKTSQEIVSQLLLSSLLHLKNHILSSQQFPFVVLEQLSDILDLFVSSWQKREEERKKLEQEKESLYRFKTVYHDSGPDDERISETDFRQRFPNFQKDFLDLMPSDITEKETEAEESRETDDSTHVNENISLILSKEEMKEIYNIHYQLFTNFTKPLHWIVSEQEPKDPGTGVDLLKPFLLTQKTMTCLSSEFANCWYEAYDAQVVGGQLLVSAALEEVISQQSFGQLGVVQNPVVDHCYDVYRDANITEIIQCEPVIRRLLQRLHQLQGEWPEHPTLKQLETIANRILSFPLTSPIMKVLSGLELLLHKAQDWESVAAKHVSLEAELHDISNLIVDWRKFELGYWKNSLDITSQEVEIEASRWWFHFYQLVFAFIKPAPETDISKPASDLEKEIIASLKQFLENSSLGEFKVRLRIVYAFHCQLTNMESSPEQKLLLKLLWNIHEFYKQFLPAVESEIEQRRIPIEKELKGFVKIARWTDINYWALRQATEKTHRTVHKHIQAFRKVLLESVKSVLVCNSASTGPQSEEKELTPEIWLQPIAWVGDYNIIADYDICLPDVPEGSLLSRLPTLLPKLNKHYVNLQKRIPYPKLLLAFDEFTCEVIEGIEERRSMTVTPSADLEKKKKEAKHINLKQRQGLSNLYKHLAKIGLSYKKGLIRSEEDHGDAFLYINPVDIKATVETVGTTSVHHGPVFKSMWKSSQKFYLNCLARHNQLKSILQNPEAKDFGLANIDRCRGFSEHMKQILVDQQCMLAKLSDNYFELRKILGNLKCPSLQKSVSLPTQNEFMEWMSSLECVTVKCYQGISQFQVLLKCCPVSNTPDSGSCLTPLPVHTVPQTSFMSMNDPTWNLCMEKIDEILSKVKVIFKKTLTKLRNRSLYSWNDLYILETGYVHLRESLVPLQQIELMFLEPEYAMDSSFTECLTFLQSEIQSSTNLFFLWHKKQKPEEIEALIKQCDGQARRLTMATLEQHAKKSVDPFPDDNLLKDYFDTLIANILFPIQKLLENHKETEEKVKEMKSEKSAEKNVTSSDTEILNGHLTQQLHKMLFDDVKRLNCEMLIQTTNKVIGTLTSSWDCIVKSNPQQIASVAGMKSLWIQSMMGCLPLLEVFSCLIENYLLYLLITHQITGKLYDGLLIHFIELATKGFFVLPETSENTQEGATQFEDKEGGGMGEGEGVKDVSDQIETEDQLEDVNQKDKEKPSQDTEDQPNVAAEDNAIEMSDDFDGKTHDPDEEFDENEESEDDDDNELDKKMGDVDNKDADKLDDQLWGSDDEEQQSEEKEETGPGAAQESESQIVAKNENEESDKPNKEEKPEESEMKEEDVEEKVNEPEAMDESEYNDKVDPYHGKEQTQEEKAENLDLPEDLKLDEAEASNDKDEEMAAESPPNIEEAKAEEPKDTAESKETDEDKNNTSEKDDSSREDENQAANDVAAPMDVDDVEEVEDEKQDASDVADEEDSESKKNAKEEEETSAAPQIKDKKIESEENMDDDEEDNNAPEVQSDKFYGISEDQKQNAEQSELAQDTGGQNDGQQEQQKPSDGASALSEEIESLPNKSATDVTRGSNSEGSQKPDSLKPSNNDSDRSLGNKEEQYQKHMKTLEEVHQSDTEHQGEEEEEDDDEEEVDKQNEKSDLYQHVSESSSHYNQQMMDVATEKQQSNIPHYEDVEEDDEDEDDDDIESIKDSDDSYIEEDIDEDDDDDDDVEMIESNIVKNNLGANIIEEYVVDDDDDDEEDEEDEDDDDEEIVEESDTQIQPSSVDLSGEKIMTAGASRPPESTIHTEMKYFDRDDLVDIEELRAEIEEQLCVWSSSQLYGNTVAMERQANEMWQLYEQVTGSLSQELCEQLRLILEPSRATKLKGDYRTGKRINMKKVIPYIASQFRKDKIWLRRTKPSKRDYQVLLAIDDSSSMVDNHSKQLAFESLAVIANALSLLEVGELSICSFGECVQIVHPFKEPFSCQSGANLLQHFTFSQKKTNIAQLLQQSTSILLETRQHHQSQISSPNLSQLLLIVSDGRGLFAEGVDIVKTAVRQAHNSNIFVVFVVLDNPLNKDSILDIRIPVFKAAGQLPEIKSYMDHFPFPFYIILRDIDSLPQTLSDALRQWFELVTIEQQ